MIQIVAKTDKPVSFELLLCLLWQDVAEELAEELQATPDLIIGNYSDGNLVASLLAHKLGVTQVCVSTVLHRSVPRH